MQPSTPSPTIGAQSFTCLVVEDDPPFADMLSRFLREEGCEPVLCDSLATARGACSNQMFDLVLLDNRLPDGMGSTLHPWLARHQPQAVTIMITGAPELSQAVELTRNGLFDYLTKPVRTHELTECFRRVRQRLAARKDSEETGAFLGNSPPVRDVLRALRQAARHLRAPVLLTGETGTGKELAARMLHQLSWSAPERNELPPFVALNCPAVPSEMFEAELFGSEKGAYTGADRRRTGLVEAAERGTLFLDEVAEIPLGLQAKLLRFLESREYRPLGTTQNRHFSGRVVAATNRLLPDEVAQGRFREDLMFRLDVFTIQLPPLRSHVQDLELLAEGLLEALCSKYGRARLHLRTAALAAVRHYPFPGNVRELRNLLERSLLKTAEDAKWLELDLAWLQHLTPGTSPPNPAVAPTSDTLPRPDLNALELQEYHLIAQALREEHGGIRRAAQRLGITHQKLLRRLQKWPELRPTAAAGA